jgi:hypothetical protein
LKTSRAAAARVLAAAALLIAALPARAVTYAFQDYTCPLDGQTFTQGLPTSGPPVGSMLDLKPYGPVLAPAVLPVCPGSRLPLYKREFAEAEVRRLRHLTTTASWLAIRDTETDYFRTARLRQWLGDDPVDVAFAYLYATWEVDETPERYARYAQEALAAVEAAMPTLGPAANDGERGATLQLVAVELERRLSRFDDAGRRIARLAPTAAFSGGTLHDLLLQQRALVAARDAHPHRMAAAGAATR